jgi:hypothetical protein
VNNPSASIEVKKSTEHKRKSVSRLHKLYHQNMRKPTSLILAGIWRKSAFVNVRQSDLNPSCSNAFRYPVFLGKENPDLKTKPALCGRQAKL